MFLKRETKWIIKKKKWKLFCTLKIHKDAQDSKRLNHKVMWEKLTFEAQINYQMNCILQLKTAPKKVRWMLPKLHYAICLNVYRRSKCWYFSHYHFRQVSSHSTLSSNGLYNSTFGFRALIFAEQLILWSLISKGEIGSAFKFFIFCLFVFLFLLYSFSGFALFHNE